MFIEVFSRVAFLIAVSLLGWYTGKKFKTNSKDISNLLIYVFSPLVCFILIVKSPVDVTYVTYAAVFYITACICSLFVLWYSKKLIWDDNRSNLLAAAAGHGNVGYFVLPLAIGLLQGGNEGSIAIGIVVFIKVASSIYEFTMAYYLTARGIYTIRESLVKVARMPTLHAAILALIVKSMGIELPKVLVSGLDNFTGGYSVLGMMLVGMSLARFEKFSVDWKFIFYSLLWKHVLYAVLVITFFSTFFHLSYAEKIVLVMVACNPLAGNISAVATALDVHPEKAACAIMISSVVAIITVPLTIAYVLPMI